MPPAKDQLPDYSSLIVKADTQDSATTGHRYPSGILMSKHAIEGNGAVPQSKYRRDAPLWGGGVTTDLPREFVDAR